MRDLSAALVFISFATMIAWLLWVASGDAWWPGKNSEIQLKLEDELNLHCRQPNASLVLGDSNINDFEDCSAAFVMWISGGAASMVTLMFAIALNFLGRSILGDQGSRMQTLLKVFAGMAGLSFSLLWVAAQIVAAESKLADQVQVLAGTSMVLMLGMLCSAVGWSALKMEVMKVPMVKKIVGSNLGDYAKALFVLMGLPMLFVFIILSF